MSSRLLRGYACACVLLVVACSDDPSAPASTPPAPVLESRSSDLRVSDPIAIAFVGDETLPVAFVSVQSGTLQNVSSATLRASGLGAQLPLRHVQVVDGGFDPEGLIAAVGDTVRMAVTSMSGAVTNFFNIVPQERAPSVVRILPHFLQGDVALDTRVRIVFSEPLDEARLNNAAVELRTGNTTVETRLQTDSTRLVIEVTPLRHLEYGTTYGIQISPLITDASGQQLEGQLSSAFTTVHGSESPIKCGVGNAMI